MSWILRALTFWNPLGHSRPVTGLFYLYICIGAPTLGHIRHAMLPASIGAPTLGHIRRAMLPASIGAPTLGHIRHAMLTANQH